MQVPEQQNAKQQPAPDVEALTRALVAPFDAGEVKWKAQAVSKDGRTALAVAYVDARVIQDRLDEVLGVLGWQDNYKVLPHGTVMCRLRIRLGEQWITKVDVGGPSEQPDDGDRTKAAFSDALKRAAVKFGIGRYLYRLPAQWVEYDSQKRQFARPPKLPAAALPPRAVKAAPPKDAAEPVKAEPAPRKASAKAAAGHTMPANGSDLQRRLYDYDKRLAAEGVCRQGDLVKHVVAAGTKAGYDGDLATWSGPAIALAVEQTKEFEACCREQATRKKDVA
jgi:hypothetical protein